MNGRSGMFYSAERSRRPRTLSRQGPEVGLTVGRSGQLAYSTLPIASASFAPCRRVPELCYALLSQAVAHAGEWLRATPADEGTQLLPLDMRVA